MFTNGWRQRHRNAPRLAAVVALSLFALGAAGPAAAASCGERVIDDWNADGRVDGTDALHCYDDAIEALPRDVRDYSSAKEDIERAMQDAMRGGPSSGTDGGSSGGTGGNGDPGDPTDTTVVTPGDTPGDTVAGPEAAPEVDTTSSDSIPLPLLVLAVLAVLLLAGGSAGYLLRRLQARRVPPASL